MFCAKQLRLAHYNRIWFLVGNLCLDHFPMFANAVVDVKGGCVIGLCWVKPRTAKFEENVCGCVFGRLLGAVNLFL